jgi:hypothetical protein
MRRLLALCALLAVPAAGLACGDDGGGGGGTTDEATDQETISLDDWVADADEICAANDAEIDDLEAPSFSLEEDLTDDELQQVADFLSDAATIQQETVDSLRALPSPDESAEEVTDVLDTVQNAIDDTNEAATAAGAGDQQEAEDFLQSAGDQFDEASEMAADLGLEECGQDGGGGNTGRGDTGDTGRTGDAG